MKLNKDEFKALQLYWYERLAKGGFKDIEKLKGEELIIAQPASYCYRNMDALTRFLKTEYFRCMAQLALDESTVFRNKIDRHIMIRHGEGAKIKVIVTELIELGTPRVRASVRFIIRRYEMAWGIKNYNHKQLNKKIVHE